MALLAGQFPTFRGLNYYLGMTATGGSAWPNWLAGNYNSARSLGEIQYMKSLGARVIRCWIFLDGFVDKTDVNWGTVAWTPTYIASVKTNWEDLLTNAIAEGIKLIPVLFIPTSSNQLADKAYLFDSFKTTEVDATVTCAFQPTVDGAALVDATTLNGNLVDDPWTNGFTKTGTATWQNVTGTPGLGALKEIEIVGSSLVRTAKVTFNTDDPLCRWQIDVKGNGVKVEIRYLNASNVEVGLFIAYNTANYADWTTLTFGSLDLSELAMASGATQMHLVVTVSAGNTSYMSGQRCSYASHSAKWQNYVDLAQNFCVTLYGSGSAYAAAISAWNLSNEPFDQGWAPFKCVPFFKGVYDAISGASNFPVIQDSVTTSPYTTAANQGWYANCDVIAFHRYSTDGSLPQSDAVMAKPWMLGEMGAALAGNAYKSTTLNPPALQKMFDAAWARGALCACPFDFQTNESISTPALPNRLTPFTDAAAGTTIKQWTVARRFLNAGAETRRGLRNNI